MTSFSLYELVFFFFFNFHNRMLFYVKSQRFRVHRRSVDNLLVRQRLLRVPTHRSEIKKYTRV